MKNTVQKFSTCTFWSKITPKTIVNGLETVLINISTLAKLHKRMLELLCSSFLSHCDEHQGNQKNGNWTSNGCDHYSGLYSGSAIEVQGLTAKLCRLMTLS